MSRHFLDGLHVAVPRGRPDDRHSVGARIGVLTGDFWLLQALGLVMTIYGLYVCYLMLRRPEELAIEENHVSWTHMYRMMFVCADRVRDRLSAVREQG